MIKIRRSRCTECRICMVMCSWIHFETNTTKQSRIRIEADWPETLIIQVCLACKDHECVNACPNGALTWDRWIRLDKELCDACGICVESCRVKGIHTDPATRFPLVCDTCNGGFQCIEWCPTNAIERAE